MTAATLCAQPTTNVVVRNWTCVQEFEDGVFKTMAIKKSRLYSSVRLLIFKSPHV